jgi:hypothetical protein
VLQTNTRGKLRGVSRDLDWDDRTLPLEPMFENEPPIANERDAVFAIRDALSRALPDGFEIELTHEVTGEAIRHDLLINRKGAVGHRLAVEVKPDLEGRRFLWRWQHTPHASSEIKVGSGAVPIKYFTVNQVTQNLDGIVADIRRALGVKAAT